MTREEKIFKRLKEHLNYIKENYPQYEVIFIGLQGSQNYNLDMYTDEYMSDVDTKAIIVPTLEQIALNKQPVSKTVVLPNNEHCDLKDVRVIFQTFKKMNINFLEILFTKFKIINPRYKDLLLELIDKREDIAHMNYNQSLRCMSGMSMEKRKALTHPYEGLKDKIEKYGYDGKQLHHIIRMNYFIKAFIEGYSFEKCLTIYKDKDLLTDAKLNRFTLHKAIELADKYDQETHRIMEANLKEEDTFNTETNEFIDNIQYKIIKRALENELEIKNKSFDYNTMEQNYDNIFVTSDIHFCHANILKFEDKRWDILDVTFHNSLVEHIKNYNKYYQNLEHSDWDILEDLTYKDAVDIMNEKIIERWNKTVKENDLVFILGDIALRYPNIKEVNTLISRLNGDKILILGNHDYPIIQDKSFDKTLFKDIVDYKVIKVYGKCISLFHYPIERFFNQDKGAILLYGHIHSTILPQEIPHAFNVGMDVNNYKPVNIKEFISIDNQLKDVITNRHNTSGLEE